MALLTLIGVAAALIVWGGRATVLEPVPVAVQTKPRDEKRANQRS